MIVRTSGVRIPATVTPAWEGFAWSQKLGEKARGYVSQPAHARLSARIASSMLPEIFGHLHSEVIEAVGQHDVGWSARDLAALEQSSSGDPASFLDISAPQATEAWRHSIRAAEDRSLLQAALTSRHFCLLSPKDRDPAHEKFVREENRRRGEMESRCGVNEADLDHYTAVLGFCDLMSLLMCSGLEGKFKLPLAHPAHPDANQAPFAVCELGSGELKFNRPVLNPRTMFSIDVWARTDSGFIASDGCEWKAE